jgi:hypothetical protein
MTPGMTGAVARQLTGLGRFFRTERRSFGNRRFPGPWVKASQHPDSLLLVTLDSCRWDTFERVPTPNIDAVGPAHRVMAPSYFTFASHAAMFMGFTPGDGLRAEPIINPKFGKLVRMHGGGTQSRGRDRFVLKGRSMIDGFNRLGHVTAGSGAVNWFNDAHPATSMLVRDFQHYWYAGNCWSLGRQLDFLARMVGGARQPVFCFLNVGETHVPYWHKGASWSRSSVTCRAFAETNDAQESARRQGECLAFVDRTIGPILQAFCGANIMVCGDHGDAWGEDGVWEHGFHHPKVMEVPVAYRLSPR